MAIALLHHINRQQNMARFYRIEVLQDLFGMVTLERSWGRIGSRGQRLMLSYPSITSAEHELLRLLQVKRKRGYTEITAKPPDFGSD